MKASRFTLYRRASLSFAFFFMIAGCATISYTPTQESIPRISYAEAAQKLDVLKGNRIFIRNRYLNIADVKTSFDRVDIIYKKQGIFNIETGETDKETFYLKSLVIPSVLKEPNNMYYLRFPDRRMLLLKNENDAIACANALFILKRRAEGYRPPVDAAAEAAFQEEARKYREMKVKPALPEEAHKFAVQGDFAAEKKNLSAAADRYADALKVAPWWSEGHFKRGLVLADIEQYDEAIGEMKKYLLLAPNGKDARAAQDNIYKWESAGPLIAGQSAASPAAVASTFTGTVTRSIATNPRWYGVDVLSKLETVADNGDKVDFIVYKSALIYDTDGQQLTTIKSDKKAEIKYSIITDGNRMTNGKNKAISIRYLE
jgi:tetratricopeptide (TPR) repeat protein